MLFETRFANASNHPSHVINDINLQVLKGAKRVVCRTTLLMNKTIYYYGYHGY